MIVAAAYLHDVLEDTLVTPEDLCQEFGAEVTGIVQAVTYPASGTRRERQAETFLRTRKDPRAVIVKLADRVANVDASASTPRFYEMYRREHAEFEALLRRPGEYDALWDHIESCLGLESPRADTTKEPRTW